MVKLRHGSSHSDGTKVKLPMTRVLAAMFGGVVMIHAILFWKMAGNGPGMPTDVSSNVGDRGVPQISIQRGKQETTTVIPFVVSMTKCGEDPFMEGAAVLKYSIHQNSIHGSGRYDYKMYAIYHPDATECAKHLEELGYELVKRETPVKVEDIQADYLRERIEKNGCCGSKVCRCQTFFTFFARDTSCTSAHLSLPRLFLVVLTTRNLSN